MNGKPLFSASRLERDCSPVMKCGARAARCQKRVQSVGIRRSKPSVQRGFNVAKVD